MKVRTTRVVTYGGLLAGVILFVVIMRLQNRQLAALEHKASRLDEVCTYVKVVLKSDIRELERADADNKFPRWRPHIAEQIYTDHVGNDPTTLRACMSTEFDVERLRSCTHDTARGDYACLIGLLRDTLGAIDGRP